ncbi:MAG: peptidyl-tRNA hydrolase [Nitrososphaerales archaeon]
MTAEAFPEIVPVLYILMRGDLDSMNAGKGMAQASHAASAFAMCMTGDTSLLYKKWFIETRQGFGTVLVLSVNETEMRTAVTVGNQLGYICDVIHDPSYPIRDGEICHFLPIDTCAYVFGDKNDPLLSAVVGNFPLHP